MIANLIIKPIKPNQKCIFGIDDALFGGIAAGLGSVVGGIFGGKSNKDAQASANETNLQIAQMNNEFNERMLEKQIAYNRENQATQNQWSEDMYNKYNSPEAQVEQMKSAGLNPYTNGVGSIGSNQTSAQAGSINPPTATPVQVHPETGMGDALQNASSMLLQLPRIVAETEGQKLDNVGKQIENDFKVAQFQADLNNLVANTKNLELKNNFQELSNRMFQRTFDMEVERKEMENKRLDLEIQSAAAVLVQENVKAEFARQDKLKDLELKSKQIITEAAKGKLTEQQFKTEVHRTAQEYCKAKYADEYQRAMLLGAYEQYIRQRNENSTYEELGTYDGSVTHEQVNQVGGQGSAGASVGKKGAGASAGVSGGISRTDKVTYKTKRSNVTYDGKKVKLYDK